MAWKLRLRAPACPPMPSRPPPRIHSGMGALHPLLELLYAVPMSSMAMSVRLQGQQWLLPSAPQVAPGPRGGDGGVGEALVSRLVMKVCSFAVWGQCGSDTTSIWICSSLIPPACICCMGTTRAYFGEPGWSPTGCLKSCAPMSG